MQVTPEKRAQAKQMAYGLLYGMGKHALAKNMGVSPDTAQQLSDSFRASIPTLVSLASPFDSHCLEVMILTRRVCLRDLIEPGQKSVLKHGRSPLQTSFTLTGPSFESEAPSHLQQFTFKLRLSGEYPSVQGSAYSDTRVV